MNITITLDASDLEPILRKAAHEAALYGGWVDHVTRRTYNPPQDLKWQPEWKQKYLRAKRIVEAFGVEHEATSEQETLTVHYPHVGGKKINRGFFVEIVGSAPDYKNPIPEYWRGVHANACEAAADRVVRRWRESINGSAHEQD